jgi:hypothetical protein
VRLGSAVAAFAASLALAGPVLAARLVDVRVGTHPGYARVVLETDAPAEHELVSIPEAIPGEVVVHIAASARAREVASRGPGAPSVSIEPQADGSALARIRAPGPVRIETQVLAAPPRVVLDLRRAAEELPGVDVVAEAPAAEPPAPPAPALEPTPEPVASPEPVAPVPVETPVVAPETSIAVETPPAVEPPPVAEPPPPREPPAPVAAPTAAAAPAPPPSEPAAPPPVAAPPPASIALDPRSLATGIALGVAVALFAFAVTRGRRAEPALPLPPVAASPDPEQAPAPEPAVEPAPAASPPPPPILPDREMDLVLDFLRMHQRLDERLAALADRVERIAARQAELESASAAQAGEIAAQRAAIARLQRAAPPRRTEPNASRHRR